MGKVNIILLLLAGALAGALVMKVSQHPARIAAAPKTVTRPAAPATVLHASPATVSQPETAPITPAAAKPPEIAALEPSRIPIAQPNVAPATTPTRTRVPAASRETPVPRPEPTRPQPRPWEREADRKPSPMRRASPSATIAMSPRPLHTPPQRVEIEAAPPQFSAPPPVNPPSPPVLPEQPKETPPARMEPENVTPLPTRIASAPEPNQATLNAGMLIPVRLLDSLSSERNHSGDTFAATLDRELVANGFVVAERGARVEGRVTAVDRDARTFSVELISVHTSDNQSVPVQTLRFDKQSEPDRSNAAAKIGAGAAIGAVIGGIAGGGKGAAIGAGAGGGIGAGDVLLTRKAASLTPETRVTFRLRAPVTITEHAQ